MATILRAGSKCPFFPLTLFRFRKTSDREDFEEPRRKNSDYRPQHHPHGGEKSPHWHHKVSSRGGYDHFGARNYRKRGYNNKYSHKPRKFYKPRPPKSHFGHKPFGYKNERHHGFHGKYPEKGNYLFPVYLTLAEFLLKCQKKIKFVAKIT